MTYLQNDRTYDEEDILYYNETYLLRFVCLDCQFQIQTFLDYSACPLCGSGYFINEEELEEELANQKYYQSNF